MSRARLAGPAATGVLRATGPGLRWEAAGPPEGLPLALHGLHHRLTVGTAVRFGVTEPLGDLLGDRLDDVLAGAGFVPGPGRRHLRGRTLADTVGPGLRLLVCGVNPSLYSADAGVGYARPGNRFWPAALAAGLVAVDRDPVAALTGRAVGMTDLVKRATRRAEEVGDDELRAGLDRVARLAAWLRPGAVCFVGLSGWRAAVDRRAVPGWQPDPVGGVPAYVMPSTSGRNARTSPAELAAHLRAASAGPAGQAGGGGGGDAGGGGGGGGGGDAGGGGGATDGGPPPDHGDGIGGGGGTAHPAGGGGGGT